MATQVVQIPNPGTLTVKGNAVKGTSAQSAAVSGPGIVKLSIRPKGKWKRRLNQRGRAKLRTKIVYTPRNGKSFSRIRGIHVKKK
jgi:hypothetical protein